MTGTDKSADGQARTAGGRTLARKDTQIVFRTTEECKDSLRGFFAERGLTLSRGIQLACLYLEQQVKSGWVEVGASGLIQRKEGR